MSARRSTRRTANTYHQAELESDEDDDFVEFDLDPQVIPGGEVEAGSAAAAAAAAATANKQGLTEAQELQLFIDIQSNGGIDEAKPAEQIYCKKEDIYGSNKSVVRRKFRNKFNWWKNEQRGRIDFNKQIQATGILATSTPSKYVPAPHAPAPEPRETSRPKTQSKAAVSKTKSTPDRLGKPSLATAPRPNPFLHHSTGPTSMAPSAPLASMRLAAINQQNVRVANWEQPERNGGVALISLLLELEHNGFHRRGFLIQFKGVDMRFLLDNVEWYKVFVAADSEVIVQFPACSWSFLNDPDSTERGRTRAKDNNARHILSDRVLRTGMRADPDRQVTTVLFKFEETTDGETEPIPLDNNIFSPNESDGSRVKPGIIPLVAADGKAATHADVYFVVGIHEENPSRIEEPKAAGTNPLALQLSQMGFGNYSNHRPPAPPPHPFNAPAPAPAHAPAPPPASNHAPAPAPAPAPASSLQLALDNGSGTEMVTFEEEQPDKRTAGTPGPGAKRRAVLLEGDTDVWSIDHLTNETLAAMDEVNSEAVVAIHPITQEKLTHNEVMEFVESKSYISKLTVAEGIQRLKELGATDHQSAMDLLFPTAAV